MAQNVIGAINGPVVKVRRTADFSMMEMVLDVDAIKNEMESIRQQFS